MRNCLGESGCLQWADHAGIHWMVYDYPAIFLFVKCLQFCFFKSVSKSQSVAYWSKLVLSVPKWVNISPYFTWFFFSSIYPLSFHIIQLRVTEGMEPIATIGREAGYMLYRSPVSRLGRQNLLESPITLTACFWTLGGSERQPSEKHGENMKTPQNSHCCPIFISSCNKKSDFF